MSKQPPECCLSVEDTAKRLKVCGARVRQLLLSGELQGWKHGERAWKIPVAEVDRYVEEHE